MPIPNDTLLLILAALAACAAITLLLLGMRKRPTRKTPHCPRCQYNLAGLIYEQTGQTNPPCPTCPECGHTATGPRQLLRLRRRRGIIALALLLFAVAFASYQGPEVRMQGRWGFVPLSLRVAVCRAVGTEAIPSLTESLVDALQHSGRVRGWHIRWLAQANPPAIIVPDAWLPGIPLRLGVNNFTFHFIPVNLDPSVTDRFPPSDEFRESDPRYTYYTQWTEPTFVLMRISPILDPDTKQLQTEALGIHNIHNSYAPPTPVQFIIPLRASLDEIKTPLDPQTAGDALQTIAPRLVQQPPTGSWGITTSFADASKSLPQATALALRLTILRDGKPIAEARWRQRPGESLSIMGTPAPLRAPGSNIWRQVPDVFPALATPLELDPNDTTLTVRITTDEELALCDFSATHYWRGDVTLPISALFAPTP
jgi:hypothetical protein